VIAVVATVVIAVVESAACSPLLAHPTHTAAINTTASDDERTAA